jgi:hypothetical protein
MQDSSCNELLSMLIKLAEATEDFMDMKVTVNAIKWCDDLRFAS